MVVVILGATVAVVAGATVVVDICGAVVVVGAMVAVLAGGKAFFFDTLIDVLVASFVLCKAKWLQWK
jgi:hypothetical protein